MEADEEDTVDEEEETVVVTAAVFLAESLQAHWHWHDSSCLMMMTGRLRPICCTGFPELLPTGMAVVKNTFSTFVPCTCCSGLVCWLVALLRIHCKFWSDTTRPGGSMPCVGASVMVAGGGADVWGGGAGAGPATTLGGAISVGTGVELLVDATGIAVEAVGTPAVCSVT